MSTMSSDPSSSAATATSEKNGHSALPTPVPVRIDVTSEDKNIRIIDTLLVDPTCWPIPLYSPLRQAVEENVREYAHTILSDMEVHGMGRTVRHFTGRVDLYSAALQTKIEDQLRPQLLAIATGDLPKPKGSPTKISIRLVVHGVAMHEDILWDCSVPVSPFDFARDMAEDWNLPDEAVVPIATAILEQLYGLSMDTSPDVLAGPSNNSRRGAWTLETKENIAVMGQLVAQHRPEEVATRTEGAK
jgi:hypothetical protein